MKKIFKYKSLIILLLICFVSCFHSELYDYFFGCSYKGWINLGAYGDITLIDVVCVSIITFFVSALIVVLLVAMHFLYALIIEFGFGFKDSEILNYYDLKSSIFWLLFILFDIFGTIITSFIIGNDISNFHLYLENSLACRVYLYSFMLLLSVSFMCLVLILRTFKKDFKTFKKDNNIEIKIKNRL